MTASMRPAAAFSAIALIVASFSSSCCMTGIPSWAALDTLRMTVPFTAAHTSAWPDLLDLCCRDELLLCRHAVLRSELRL